MTSRFTASKLPLVTVAISLLAFTSKAQEPSAQAFPVGEAPVAEARPVSVSPTPVASARRVEEAPSSVTQALEEQTTARQMAPFTATLNYGANFSDGLTDAYLDTIIPLLVTPDQKTGLFGNVYVNSRDDHTQHGSLGLGIRHMIEDWGLIAGVRGHIDASEMASGSTFTQAGIGFDIFHQSGIDIHGNWYFGDDSSDLVNEFEEISRTTQQSTRVKFAGDETSLFTTPAGNITTSRFDDPFARGNQVLQNLVTSVTPLTNNFQRYQRFARAETTTKSYDTTRFFEQFESGADGGDVRAEIPVPILSKFTDLNLMVGGYHYNMPYGRDLTGLMAGIDWKPIQALGLGVTYYEHEQIFGGSSNVVVSVNGSIPLEKNMFQGGFADALATAFQPQERLSLDQRFFQESSPRLNRVLTQVSDPIENKSKRFTKLVGKEVTLGPKFLAASNVSFLGVTAEPTVDTLAPKVILDNVIFVNNGGAVGNGIQAGRLGGAGTAEDPTTSINEGANRVQTVLGGTGTVYVQAAGVYAEEVVVDASGADVASGVTPVARLVPAATTDITFTSSFKPIVACAGFNFGGDTARADVAGGFMVRDIERAHIQAFNVTGGLTFDVTDPPAVDNQIGMAIVGVGVNNYIVDCNITNTARTGIAHHIENTATTLTQIFDNEVLGTTDGGFEEGTGILVRLQGTGAIGNMEIFDNIVSDTSRNGIMVQTEGTSSIAGGFINNNTITRAGDSGADVEGRGIYVNATSVGTGYNLASINENIISETAGAGVYVRTTSRAISSVGTIDANIISDTVAEVNSANGNSRANGDGIFVQATTNNNGAGSMLDIASISSNILTDIDSSNAPFGNNSGSRGIEVRLENNGGGSGASALTIGAIDANIITNVADTGIDILSLNSRSETISRNVGTLDITSIDGNIITNTDQEGIRIFGGASGTYSGGTLNRVADSVTTIGSVNGNIIADVAGSSADIIGGDAGIQVAAQEDSIVNFTSIDGNVIASNGVGGRGIYLVVSDGLLLTPSFDGAIFGETIAGNVLTDLSNQAIHINATGNPSPGRGAMITLSDGAGGGGILSNIIDTTTTTFDDGIQVRLDGDNTAAGDDLLIDAISFNTISNVTDEGIQIQGADGPTASLGRLIVGDVNTNTITNTGLTGEGDGILILSQDTYDVIIGDGAGVGGINGNIITTTGMLGEGIQLTFSNTALGSFNVGSQVANIVTGTTGNDFERNSVNITYPDGGIMINTSNVNVTTDPVP